jgi:DNA-binding CsgD family transcriptional regulator
MQKKTHDPGLSARELVVLQHLAHSMRLPANAERLELSERTLETYVTRAQEKLGAKTSTEAVAIAIRLRLI